MSVCVCVFLLQITTECVELRILHIYNSFSLPSFSVIRFAKSKWKCGIFGIWLSVYVPRLFVEHVVLCVRCYAMRLRFVSTNVFAYTDTHTILLQIGIVRVGRLIHRILLYLPTFQLFITYECRIKFSVLVSPSIVYTKRNSKHNYPRLGRNLIAATTAGCTTEAFENFI